MDKYNRIVILGRKVCRDAHRAFHRSAFTDSNTLTVVADIRDLAEARLCDSDAECLQHFVPLRGQRNVELGESAARIYERMLNWIEASPHGPAFGEGEMSLLRTGRMLIEFSILYQLAIMSDGIEFLLHQAANVPITVLTSSGGTSSLVSQIAEKIAYGGEIEVTRLITRLPGDLNWKGRVETFVAKVPMLRSVIDPMHYVLNVLRRSRAAMLPKHPFAYFLPFEADVLHRHSLTPIIDASRKIGMGPNVAVTSDARLLAGEDIKDPDVMLDVSLPPSLAGFLRVWRQSRQLAKAWRRFRRDERFQRVFDLGDISLWAAAKTPLDRTFAIGFPLYARMTEMFQHTFRNARPQMVVASSQYNFLSRLGFALARRYGVPSLAVQCALVTSHPFNSHMVAHRAAVLDDYARRIFTEADVDEERLIATGLPRWDAIVNAVQHANPDAVREQLGADASHRIVTFATQPIPDKETRGMLRATMKAVAASPDHLLIVKTHPCENTTKYEQLVEAFNINMPVRPLVVGKIDLYGLITASQLLITGYSNVAYEAAIAGITVVTINLSGEPDALPFVENGLAVGAYSEAEAEEAIVRLLSDTTAREEAADRRRDYFQRNPHVADGRATQRVVALMKEMAEQA